MSRHLNKLLIIALTWTTGCDNSNSKELPANLPNSGTDQKQEPKDPPNPPNETDKSEDSKKSETVTEFHLMNAMTEVLTQDSPLKIRRKFENLEVNAHASEDEVTSAISTLFKSNQNLRSNICPHSSGADLNKTDMEVFLDLDKSVLFLLCPDRPNAIFSYSLRDVGPIISSMSFGQPNFQIWVGHLLTHYFLEGIGARSLVRYINQASAMKPDCRSWLYDQGVQSATFDDSTDLKLENGLVTTQHQ